jgi:hypothetical protein
VELAILAGFVWVFMSPSGGCFNDGLYSYFIFVVLLCFNLTSSYSQITHQLLSTAICGVTSMTSRTHGQVLRQSLITMEIIRMLLFLMQDQDIGMILTWWGYWVIGTLVGCNASLVSTRTFSIILKTHRPHYMHTTLWKLVVCYKLLHCQEIPSCTCSRWLLSDWYF